MSGMARFGMARFGMARFRKARFGMARFGKARFGMARFGTTTFLARAGETGLASCCDRCPIATSPGSRPLRAPPSAEDGADLR